jgi:peptidyl-prolyl cis-trans isomerase SurA
MIKIKGIAITCLVLVACSLNAQNSNDASELSQDKYTIFSYGDSHVLNDEFMRVFNKNKRDEVSPTQQEIEEYLDLYIKFKLKVAEAYSRKMDTIPSFIQELAGYRVQLAQPYLTDKSVTDRLVKEAYDRSIMEVQASHIMAACAPDAAPIDTLIAYNKLLGLRTRIVENNENFGDIAEAFSDDQSAKTNKGDLGYFTAFQMIYPFENAAFNMNIGDVSMPIRTQYGYHLIYLKDKRNSLGDVKVAHLMIKFYNEGEVDSTKRRIDAVYQQLVDGADWNTAVEEFSEDFNTNNKGGELNWFNRTTGNVPNEFKDIAYELKNDGDFSKPIRTKFGWHVVKRVAIKKLPSFDESKDMLRRKVERDSRSELNKEVVVKRIKVENNYREVNGVDSVINKISEDLRQGKFKRPPVTNVVLFSIGKKNYTDADFYTFLENKRGVVTQELKKAVEGFYRQYVNISNMAYEESILEEKYPDFRYIMKEYKDGILLFELTDQEVWSKAVNDSAGLVDYYKANQANYRWTERADATIFSCKDAKTAKKATKLAKKGMSAGEIMKACNAKDALAISYENKKYEKGSNTLLDKITWAKGVYSLEGENDRVKFVQINDIIPPTDKPLDQNLGQATSDYQNYLEELWLEALKKKYPIKIYNDNVKKLYN